MSYYILKAARGRWWYIYEHRSWYV